jgi:hypothetical protein
MGTSAATSSLAGGSLINSLEHYVSAAKALSRSRSCHLTIVHHLGKQALGEKHPLIAYPLEVLAATYKGQSRLAEAEQCYQRALAILESALGAAHHRKRKCSRRGDKSQTRSIGSLQKERVWGKEAGGT